MQLSDVPVNGLVDIRRGITYIDSQSVIDILSCFQKQCGDNSRSSLLTDIVKCIEEGGKNLRASIKK